MNEVDIERWVDDAPTHQRGFREAVHIILDSIGHSRNLQARMVMKGGLLLAIRYDSSRFTRDLDFSTTAQYQADTADQLLDEFEKGLIDAENRLFYETTCRLQSRRVEPKGENRTHHNLTLTIGFADKSDRSAMARLQAKQSPRVPTQRAGREDALTVATAHPPAKPPTGCIRHLAVAGIGTTPDGK